MFAPGLDLAGVQELWQEVIKEKVVEMLISEYNFSQWEADEVLKKTWKDTPENLQIKMTGNLGDLFKQLKAQNIPKCKVGFKCAIDFYVPENVKRKALKKHLTFQMLNLISDLDKNVHFKKDFFMFMFIRTEKDIDKELSKLVIDKYRIAQDLTEFGPKRCKMSQMYIYEKDV